MAGSSATSEFLLVMIIIMASVRCVQAAPSGQSSSDPVEWLKVTVVPLLIFLIGSFLLGCIKFIRHWRTVSANGGIAVSETGQPLGDSSGSIDSAADVEAGVEMPTVDYQRHAHAEGVDVNSDLARWPPISVDDAFQQNGGHTCA